MFIEKTRVKKLHLGIIWNVMNYIYIIKMTNFPRKIEKFPVN